ncbi:MAG: hypothetical protein J0M04_11530 [Verrucomicrobia bacterium]|nr:hypothetical protein [Verrucomicrobiota bacterium]
MKTYYTIAIAAFGGLLLCAQDDPKTTPPKETQSDLIGHWTSIVELGRPGPAQITTITINRDGTYHRLEIDISSGKNYVEDHPESYSPDGAELRHSTGWINLKTGKERVSDADRKLSLESVTWTVKNDELHQTVDLGNMGGESMTYSRVE